MTALQRYTALFGVFAPLSIATIGGGQRSSPTSSGRSSTCITG